MSLEPMVDFSPLISELDKWADLSPATFWWRDDDAAEPCRELNLLLDVADGRPLALAVVPFHAGPALAARLADERNVTVFQHGWKHENHSAKGPNSEYPAERGHDAVRRELAEGAAKLDSLFGSQFVRVFTPPWHGFDCGYFPLLKELGFQGLSMKGRRSAFFAGLVQNNIHCVPIEWSNPPGLGDPARYVGQLVEHLKQRRLAGDRDEATGILTHHLVQNSESLEFLRDLLQCIDDHPSARLVDPVELFVGTHGGLSSVDLTAVRRSPASPSTIV